MYIFAILSTFCCHFYKILLNFVIDRASRNKKVKDVISGMLADEVPKTELSNPMFYLKTLFS